MTTNDPLVIAAREFGSRLFLGTGKFPSNAVLAATIESSGTEMVTVALRRIDPTADEDILDGVIGQGGTDGPVLVLTNTSGAMDADAYAIAKRCALRVQGQPGILGHHLTAGEDGHVLELGDAAVAEAGRPDGDGAEVAVDVVAHQHPQR